MEGGAWGCTFPPARVRLPNGYPGLGSLTRTAGLSPTVLSNESLACSQSYYTLFRRTCPVVGGRHTWRNQRPSRTTPSTREMHDKTKPQQSEACHTTPVKARASPPPTSCSAEARPPKSPSLTPRQQIDEGHPHLHRQNQPVQRSAKDGPPPPLGSRPKHPRAGPQTQVREEEARPLRALRVTPPFLAVRLARLRFCALVGGGGGVGWGVGRRAGGWERGKVGGGGAAVVYGAPWYL